MKQPKVNDATNYLLIKKELIKIESYGEGLKSNKDGFMSVTNLYDSQMKKPHSNVDELTLFLNNNNCLKMQGKLKNSCYRKTRLMLINTNKTLDDANTNIYYLNHSISILLNNIETIIDQYPKINY